MKLGGQCFHLLTGLFEGAGAVDFLRGVTQFPCYGHLRGDAAAGFVFAHAARRQALQLLLGAAPRNHESIKMFVHAGLDEQRRFDKRGVMRPVALPFVELAQNRFGDTRVDDGVQAREFRAICEYQSSKLGAVHPCLAVGDRWTKFAEDLFVGGLARLKEFVRERVGVKNGETQFPQHGRDRALAAGDAASQSKSQHFLNHRADAVDCEVEIAGEARRRRAALTVLLISMVIVMGPTPPGTGVSAPAALTASG